jgi:nucleoside-diphosphate-sugar epimerase
MGRTLVTGANGFVGRGVIAELSRRGWPVRAATRRVEADQTAGAEQVSSGDVDGLTDWSAALEGVDAIVHLAGRAHVMREAAADPISEFRRVNVDGTLNLARQAASAGVRRMIFISSIGVNGAETSDRHFSATDVPAPRSPYTVSKHEAEIGLRRLANETGLEVVIIRPPMVIGPGAPGRFSQLLRAVYLGIPLPLGAIDNRRSLVSLDNLADLIATCLEHPAAANETFLVSDGADLSTTDLVHRMGAAFGRSTHLIPVPARVLRLVANMVGKADVARQLCGSLQVDISKTRDLLGWAPRVRIDDALKESTRHFAQRWRS